MSRLSIVAVCVVLCALSPVGCAHGPFRPPQQAAGPLSLEPPPGVAAPAHTLPGGGIGPPAIVADVGPAEGVQSPGRREAQLMQTEIAALREQLASTSSQLAQARAAGMPAAGPASATANPVTPAVAMQSAATQLALPDVQPRFDGAVVRIDVPADRLFEADTANLLAEGTATLTKIAAEIERVFPGHYVGIEGHTDTEPLVNASWGSPHQLTTARAAAVFDFLTSRTRLHDSQLFLVAHGSNHPLVSNATPAGRARNRRVEIVVYAERAAGAP